MPFRNKFLTFRLCRNGVPVPLDSSVHFKIKHSSFKQHFFNINLVASPCGHSELIEQTLLFWIYAVSGPSQAVSEPGWRPSHVGSAPARAVLGDRLATRGPSNSDPKSMEARVPSPTGGWLNHGRFSWGLNGVTAIPAAHVPYSTLERFPGGLCQIGSWPVGRRLQELPFPVLPTETLGYHCAATRILTPLPDYHAFYIKPNWLL